MLRTIAILSCLSCIGVVVSTQGLHSPGTLPDLLPKVSDQNTLKWNNAGGEKIPGVEHSSLQSKIMQVEIGYNVYLPPGYLDSKLRYPTIYFLHGAGGDENSNARGFSPLIKKAIEERMIGPVIVVFPNGEMSGYVAESCPKLKYENFFVKELLPHIDAKYRTINSRKGRAIGGWSMGGGGALGIALKYPNLFSSVGTWAAALKDSCPDAPPHYDPFPNRLFWKLAQKSFSRRDTQIRILLIVGDKDPTKDWQQLFRDQLVAHGVPHQFILLPDVPHDLGLYHKKSTAEMIQFFAEGFASP